MRSVDIRHRIWFGGFSLILLHLFLSRISKGFAYDRNLAEKPILLFSFLEILAGLIYLVIARDTLHDSKAGLQLSKPNEYECKSNVHYLRFKARRNLVLWILGVGIATRLAMMFSTPILEDDYYRYLWDGAVLSHSYNPYAHSPREVREGSSSVPSGLRDLATESGQVIHRINYPHLRTIYPPVAQFVFAVAHFVKPWSILALRLIFLGFDLLTLVLLILVFKRLRISPLLLGLYWWNPLLIKEVYNSCHLDVMVGPFLLGAVLLVIHDRYVFASSVLAIAVGTKVWPVLLIPLTLRPLLCDSRRLLPALVFTLLPILAMFTPMVLSDLNRTSGLIAYSRLWEMNDALFMGILWISKSTLKLLQVDPWHGQFLARVLVILILCALVTRLSWKKPDDVADFCEKCLFITASLFLLGPTQFPWYYLWILPFLAIRPRFSLLLLTVMLPLYYVRFYFDARGNAQVFDNLIVWIEYMPVFFLILWETYRGYKKREAWVVKGVS
jgi:hypothetical protein